MCFEIQNGFSHAAYIIYGSGAYIPRQEVVCERTYIYTFSKARDGPCVKYLPVYFIPGPLEQNSVRHPCVISAKEMVLSGPAALRVRKCQTNS